jgi:antitoxin component YwqK of YwqJK toxin-antitoxin module
MTKILTLIYISSLALTSCGQKYNYPGQLDIKTFKIGQKVDTTLFVKKGNLYFPNYLDGWTMENYDQLPEKYHGLPIAIWQLKSDSSIALTLLNNTILNITVSYMTALEKENFSTMATNKFGSDGIIKAYQETYPLQDWITYWNLKTWKTSDVIFQIGNSDMRKPKDSEPSNVTWNLAYSDFKIENKIVDDYKKKLFSNKDDSIKYQSEINAFNNKAHPPENGLFVDHFENGIIKEKGNYKNGMKDGLWETWFDNGQKEDSAFYINDNLSGTRIMWHPNGRLQLESYWGKPDNRIGKWTRYYANGQIESITHFNDNGELDGKALQYFENGKLQREMIYDREKEISDILYNDQGKRIN